MAGMLFLLLFFAQGTYYGPPPSPHFQGIPQGNKIRVQLEIYDDPALGGVRIQNVSFNRTNIALHPPDLQGFRGAAGFQVPPGTYDLVWTISRDQIVWPRTIRHKEKIKIDPRDEWVQITIRGEEVSIL
jgi:hypothetical protein